MSETADNPPNAGNPDAHFDLKEYVDAANDASNRSRYVSIVLLIATILVFVGLNNQYFNSWFLDDLRTAYEPGDSYTRGLLLPMAFRGESQDTKGFFSCDKNIDKNCEPPAQVAKRDAERALMRMHMESRLLMRIPILGVSLHVNDLGLIGGLTLIVLLLMTRTSLSREIKNLNYSFKKAWEAARLDEFYHGLAMRQLFTVPHMKGERRNRFLSKAPYVVCLLPAVIYLMLVAYDSLTMMRIPRYRQGVHNFLLDIYQSPSQGISYSRLILLEWSLAIVIILLVRRCLERQHYVYLIWDYYWKLLKPKPVLCLLEPGVVSLFTEDGKVNEAEIKAALEKAKDQNRITKRPNLLRRFWRAVRGDIKFLKRIDREVGKPYLIEIVPEIERVFNNDKEINDKLREIKKSEEEAKGAEQVN